MKKIGTGLLKLPVKLIFLIWELWNRILYPPRIIYPDKETKRLLKHRPCILIANHTAHTDGYYIPQMLPCKGLYTYVTRKWYDKPHLKWMFVCLPYIPVNLSDMDTEWFARGKAVLESGGSVLLFPEGKLVTDGTLGEFHPGALMLAKQTGAPVLPVALPGTYRKFRRKTILVGAPIPLELGRRGRPSAVLREESDKCRTVMAQMLGIPLPDTREPAEDSGRTAEADAAVPLIQ